VREAIRITAERTFEALSTEDQQAARQLFLRLVTPGEGHEHTRARAAMPEDPSQRKIVEQFAGPRMRLLVTGSDRAGRPTVEVAHEALIRTWPRLHRWVDANREKLRARATILQAKNDWERHGRRDDMLLPAGLQLERARTLVGDPGEVTTDDINEFIAFSLAREQSTRKEQEEALAQKEAQTVERRKLYHTQANILAELCWAKLRQGEFGSALRLASHGTRIDLALPSEAIGSSPAAAALAAAISKANWRFALGVHKGTVRSVAFSPDGSRIITASSDNTARVWDAATAEEIAILRGHRSSVNSAAFSPDSSLIVTASDDQTARIWDVASAEEIAILRGHESDVTSAAFSPDGRRIVTG